MEPKIPPMKSDVVSVSSELRPTARPVKPFSEVLARGAGTVVGGAEAAMTTLPGTSLMAVALRGGTAGASAMPGAPIGSPLAGPLPGMGGLGGGLSTIAEGPGATSGVGGGMQFLSSVNAAAGAGDGGAASALQQSEQSNLYYLQLQQQVAQQSQTFETLSNVMKSESDTVKNAIGNMH